MFSYSGDPSASNLDKVRFLLGDIDENSVKLQDEEILFLITEWGGVYEAARSAAEVISGRLANKANYSRSVGDLSVSEQFDVQAQAFRDLADRLAMMKARKSPPTPRANANALKSTDDRTVTDYNTDFHVGQMDNLRGKNPNYLDGKAY